jgi:hypothetical protein
MKTNPAKALNRRQFLRHSATVGAALATFPALIPARVRGAGAPSRQITIGFIGAGSHAIGWNLPKYLKLPDVRVLAVCDVDRERMEFAKTKVDEHYKNQDCAMTTDFREVLARPDIDAVMITTPDHWHTLISVMALRAGKDVQCEKKAHADHRGGAGPDRDRSEAQKSISDQHGRSLPARVSSHGGTRAKWKDR